MIKDFIQRTHFYVTAVLFLWTCAFTLSCRLYTTNLKDGRLAASRESSLLSMLLSDARFAISGEFYGMADTYFHRGVEHIKKKALEENFFRKLEEEISPNSHVHVRDMDVQEIMPWLRLATKADPHNVQAYLVAAFWLRTGINRPDKALKILEEAQWNNPMNAKIQFAKARIYITQKELSRARSALNAAVAFMEKGEDKSAPENKSLKARILSYRAILHEIAGNNRQAARDYEKVLALFPNRKHLKDRMEALKTGKKVRTRAYKLLNLMTEADKEATPRMMFHDAGETHVHPEKPE
ncbi:MAG: tetratricopeptide repeat protein [Verrucomicrobiota bacterium]